MEFEKAVAVFKAVAVTWLSTMALAFVLVLAILHVNLIVWIVLAVVVTLSMLIMFSSMGLSSDAMRWFVGAFVVVAIILLGIASTYHTTISLDGSLFAYFMCMVSILMLQVQAVANAAGALKTRAASASKASA